MRMSLLKNNKLNKHKWLKLLNISSLILKSVAISFIDIEGKYNLQ